MVEMLENDNFDWFIESRTKLIWIRFMNYVTLNYKFIY